ncbi:hypothetical protein Tco_0067568 [Tanacetum coccineum]
MKGQDNPLIPNPHPYLLNSIIKKPIIVSSSYQHKKTHKPRKAIKITEISQSSRPINLVTDETVYKEWEDRMERAATITSSLDAEKDNGSGPRCHVTILGGVDAQTRIEASSKQSNDPPLSRGYTLRSGDDSMKLLELIELCIKLSDLVSKKKREMFLRLTLVYINAAKHKVSTAVAAVRLLTTVRHNIVLSVEVNVARHNLVLPVQVNAAEALIDKKKVIITESSIRSDLHLEDADGADCLPTAIIFEELARMRRKQKKNTEVPHPSDSTADVPNKEHVPTHSNDPLLSGDGLMKLTELMDMYTKLSERVLDLEHTKTPQAQEITNLKLKVKKLEKKAGLRTHKFKRLYKGRSRIKAIDRDAEVTLVETHRRNDENDDNMMFDTGVFDGDEIVVETKEPVIHVATTTKAIPISTDEIDLAQEITIAQALAATKSAKHKEKDMVQESSENVSTAITMVSTATTTVVATPTITIPPHQRAKGITFRGPVESTITTIVPS